jgi:hypothetical protein
VKKYVVLMKNVEDLDEIILNFNKFLIDVEDSVDVLKSYNHFGRLLYSKDEKSLLLMFCGITI